MDVHAPGILPPVWEEALTRGALSNIGLRGGHRSLQNQQPDTACGVDRGGYTVGRGREPTAPKARATRACGTRASAPLGMVRSGVTLGRPVGLCAGVRGVTHPSDRKGGPSPVEQRHTHDTYHCQGGGLAPVEDDGTRRAPSERAGMATVAGRAEAGAAPVGEWPERGQGRHDHRGGAGSIPGAVVNRRI